MKRFLLGLLFSLVASSAFAQALPVCNWGDMIYRSSTGYACVPYDNTPGKFLMGQGASAAPVWTFQANQSFVLPTQSTNTFLGNTTGGTASPTPNTVSNILDTIGYDIARPPTPGSMLYKTSVAPGNAWQALGIGASGTVLSVVAGVPTWVANTPTLDGFCSTQGAILFRNATVWNCLAPANTAGQYLNSGGAGQNVAWTPINTTTLGAVPTTRVLTAGTGLSGGGDLSADRTLSIANTIAAAGPIGTATAAPVITYNAQGQLTTVSTATITPAFTAVTGQATLAQLPTLGANVMLGAATAGTPTQLAIPSCSAANSALQWVTNTGLQCGALATGGTLTGPGSSTNTAIPRWNGTTGLVLSNSGVLIDGSNNITGVNSITVVGDVNGATVSGSLVASKAIQQTGTSAVTVVTPSQQQSHDSAAKAWGLYAVNASPANASLLRGYNVGTLAHPSAGVYTLTITPTAFLSANDYGCNFTPQGAGAPIAYQVSSTASTVTFNTISTAGVGADGSAIFISCFGRQ